MKTRIKQLVEELEMLHRSLGFAQVVHSPRTVKILEARCNAAYAELSAAINTFNKAMAMEAAQPHNKAKRVEDAIELILEGVQILIDEDVILGVRHV